MIVNSIQYFWWLLLAIAGIMVKSNEPTHAKDHLSFNGILPIISLWYPSIPLFGFNWDGIPITTGCCQSGTERDPASQDCCQIQANPPQWWDTWGRWMKAIENTLGSLFVLVNLEPQFNQKLCGWLTILSYLPEGKLWWSSQEARSCPGHHWSHERGCF